MKLTLDELLKLKGVTAKELSVKTGLTEATISHWRTRRNKPQLDNLIKITKVLGVNIEDIDV